MNKRGFSASSITIIMIIYTFSTYAIAQNTISAKKENPPVVKKDENKTINTKTTVSDKKETAAGDNKQTDTKNTAGGKTPAEIKKTENTVKPAEDKKTADNKTPADDKKTIPAKDKPKEQMDEKQKGEKIATTLEFGIQKDRKIAIGMITEIKDEMIRKDLLKKVAELANTDADMEIRKIAVTAIGDHKSAENSKSIIRALDDEIEDVKIAACYAVGKLSLAEAKPKLIEILKKRDLSSTSNFTDAVIIALGDLNAPEVIDYAIEGIKNIKNSKMIRERLILFIGKSGSALQKDFLLELFKNEEEEMIIRSYAVKSIAKLKIKEAAPAIKEVIKDIDSYNFNKKKRYYDLYMQSVAALVELGDADSIPMLMNSIRSDNAEVRYKGIILIKEFSDQRTIDILKYKMKNDPSGKVRKAARLALEEKGIIEKGKETENFNENNERNDNAEQ